MGIFLNNTIINDIVIQTPALQDTSRSDHYTLKNNVTPIHRSKDNIVV